jgi:hypothetical protein
MQGNHVVVVSSLIASELALKSALQAVVQATSPLVVLGIVLVAVYALSHHVHLVTPLLRRGRRTHRSGWAPARLFVARLLLEVVELIKPRRHVPARIRRAQGPRRRPVRARR